MMDYGKINYTEMKIAEDWTMTEQTERELTVHHDTSGFIECANVSEIPDEGVVAVNVAGQPIALVKSDGEVFAVDNRCPHTDYPLNRGSIHDGILMCHWHHAVCREHWLRETI